MARVPPRRLSGQEKVEIKALYLQGVSKQEIAKRFGCNSAQVNGIINTAINHGRLQQIPPGFVPITAPSAESPSQDAVPLAEPAEPTLDPEPTPTPEPVQEVKPVANPPAQQQHHRWDPASFGFNFTAAGKAGGFNNYTSQPSFRVERTNPPHGHLGTHVGTYDPEQLATSYGSGTYIVRLRLPNDPMEYLSEQRVSENYGPPKFPAREHEGDGRVERHDRPGPNRPPSWGPHDPYARDAYGRPYDWPRTPQPVVVGEQAASEAIRQMGALQQTFLQREAEERKNGPNQFLQEFLREQDARAARIREDDRLREETRRANEEAQRKADQLAREAQWKLERQAAEDVHRREIERIRAEKQAQEAREEKDRKFLLDLEQKKIDLIQQQAEAREKALKNDLDTRRAEIAKEIELNRKEMASLEKSVERQLEDGRKDQEREFTLRKQMLEKEQELLHKQIDLERQIAVSNTTDSMMSHAQQLVKEIRQGLNAILEHKKMEMGIPQQHPGNVTSLPEQQPAPVQDDKVPAKQEPQPSAEGQSMQADILGEFMKDPGARQLITEWARQIACEAGPGPFLGLFMDGYQDPLDHAFRAACRRFSVYIRSRTWEDVKAALLATNVLSPEEKEAFESDAAETFYEGFRICFFAEIDAFWTAVAERSAAKAQAKDAKEPKSEPVEETKG